MKQIIEINEVNQEQFKKRFLKVQKMYHRNKSTFEITNTSKFYTLCKNNKDEEHYVKKLAITIEYTPIEIDNKFLVIGYLEKNKEKNIFTLINPTLKEYIKPTILQNGYICDHCNNRRKRNSVFIVLNTETKETIKLGSSCLQKYFPYNVANLKTLFENSYEFFENDWEKNTKMNFDYNYFYNFIEFVFISKKIIEEKGYHTVNSTNSTKDEVMKELSTKISLTNSELTETEKFISELITYYSNKLDNKYEAETYNFTVFNEEKYINSRLIGKIIYFISIYLKELEVNTENKEINLEFFGEIGNSFTETVKVLSLQETENPYNYRKPLYIYKFKTNENNILTYFGTMDLLKILNCEEDYINFYKETNINKKDLTILNKYKLFLAGKSIELQGEIKSHKVNSYTKQNETIIKKIKGYLI